MRSRLGRKIFQIPDTLEMSSNWPPPNILGIVRKTLWPSVFFTESVFTPKDIDLEDGEMDDAERELEAFKRFCLQSVPPPRKEKVNLNIKDIVLKKKSSSSSSSSATAAVIAAN
ncbi:uncharacterized protein LOC124955293 [Vespa velutina]|uniref:uncharacterized protein LOC124955293 n=1 Tax=Vespa velutina TaxID=202808 RepID=UPI001FB21A17|nr:uncharacterized protein LOC124955293 [Vespa velutina]XP_047365466.1 uncharacterized protein LOC124955293 [Vespa velutina]